MSPHSPSPLPSPRDNNTFTTICAASGTLVREHRGDRNHKKQIIEEVKEYVTTHHSKGNTATQPSLLHRKVRQVVTRQLKSYRPPLKDEAEASKEERAFQTALDASCVKGLMDIMDHELARVVRDLGASDETVEFMIRWLDAAKKQNGRIAVKRRSKSRGGITMIELAGSERRYRRILKEIKTLDLWKTICPHSRGLKKCSQITLSQKVIDQVSNSCDSGGITKPSA